MNYLFRLLFSAVMRPLSEEIPDILPPESISYHTVNFTDPPGN